MYEHWFSVIAVCIATMFYLVHLHVDATFTFLSAKQALHVSFRLTSDYQTSTSRGLEFSREVKWLSYFQSSVSTLSLSSEVQV